MAIDRSWQQGSPAPAASSDSHRDSARRHASYLGLCVLLLGLAMAQAALPATTSGSVAVSATVQPAARLQRLSQPAELAITADDVARGWVEIDTPVSLTVWSNTGAYVLEIVPVLELFSRITVHGVGTPAELLAQGGQITRRSWPSRVDQLDLTLRFALPATAIPGRHPWPLKWQVQPLAEIHPR